MIKTLDPLSVAFVTVILYCQMAPTCCFEIHIMRPHCLYLDETDAERVVRIILSHVDSNHHLQHTSMFKCWFTGDTNLPAELLLAVNLHSHLDQFAL